ncbi:putative photosystem I Ycf4, assembly [Helianthus annuus]|uniref:Photosystem I assembly protein Ycf4 n=1 Tax=Helianthus annuus TaxID=4232 RepID=A0A251TVM8_HELAN|nr:putative photosystem I Ycf4, assembly [Helianthus annuus]KAJ0560858.1 putative photosystem I Ycf4, assembly [Helianthus annuus]KAJ0573898.1 putative photosystem I Ycf4, assembly [Helianthus annuus]KAJ0738232.1 putative photosystem I Ycf4, assembly [Helianthus annuus]KAJ0741127.1 putative photosystem I Ycf4, assembly [Helianthus annuus]
MILLGIKYELSIRTYMDRTYKGGSKTSNFCWAIILFLGSLGFLLVGTSSYLGRNLISLFPSQEIVFFPQGIVMSFYGIASLFISSYLWCTISWNVGSGYDRFDIKDGIVCIFRWGFPGKNRRVCFIKISIKKRVKCHFSPCGFGHFASLVQRFHF